ncbi:leader peptide processing enzyme [Breznakiellaceae bacterium SP9]
MNKKAAAVLFVLAATLFNLVLTIILFMLLLLLYANFAAPRLPQEYVAYGFPILFIASFFLSGLIYRSLVKQIMKRSKWADRLAPLFGGSRRWHRKE